MMPVARPQNAMQHTVQAFRALVSRLSGLTCTVGLPCDETLRPGSVLIWPWRLQENRCLQSKTDGRAAASRPPMAEIHCLVFAQEMETLDRIRDGVRGQPVTDDNGVSIRVHEGALDSETLLSLFSAARLVPRLCLAYVLQPIAG